MYEHHDAVLHTVREGVIIVGGDGRLLLANDEAHRLLDLPDDAERRHVRELGLDPGTADLLSSGRVATDEVHLVGDRLIAINQRPTDLAGGPPGSVATLRDSTELRALSGKADAARERLDMLYAAGVGIGTSLDVTRTAEELVELAVPRFADFATVDLFDAVLDGDEPEPGSVLRRTAVTGVREGAPLYAVGVQIRFVETSPQARGMAQGRAVLEARLAESPGWRAQDLERTEQVVDFGIHSLIAVPVRAGALVLGVVTFWRSERPDPFDREEVALAEELVTRAAVTIDNARRYTREHGMAVTLQRSLLPRTLPEQNALDIAYRYLPAQAGVGGDWFDVLPLSGARVALVVGDVVGHGLHAAATMGRLRAPRCTTSPRWTWRRRSCWGCWTSWWPASTRTRRRTAPPARSPGRPVCTPSTTRCPGGARWPGRGTRRPRSCVRTGGWSTRRCHGLPLGLGGLPFETAELELDEGSRLVLYTDGLVEDRERDIDAGLALLSGALERGSDDSPEETCRVVLDELLPPRPSDDIALIVARTRALGPDRVAEWDVPMDPAAVGEVRAAVVRQLARWELEELSFSTELILSELVTNAIRYGGAPVRVRLLRDRALICEVSDGSSTSPHLRYAAMTDEGGRGLFLVAQLAERWGTRYTPTGKIIWAEQTLS